MSATGTRRREERDGFGMMVNLYQTSEASVALEHPSRGRALGLIVSRQTARAGPRVL